jgi:Fe-Mn family superoxide dismutase
MAFELPKLPYAYDALEPQAHLKTWNTRNIIMHIQQTWNGCNGTDLEAGFTIENVLTI